MLTKGKVKTIRVTKRFELYEGYGATSNMFAVLKRITSFGDQLATTSFMPAIQMDSLIKLSDEDFDIACSKFSYQ